VTLSARNTNDVAAIAHVVGPTVADPATWIHHASAVLMLECDGDPVGVVLLVDGALPSIHLHVMPHHRGRIVFQFLPVIRDWLLTFRPRWQNVWTWVADAAHERFARRCGFVPAFATDGCRHLFHPLH
jgi:hypothetical protein